MNTPLRFACFLLPFLLLACSKSDDLDGVWKNDDGNLITFQADSVALLGQEGLNGNDKGRYRMNGDTIYVLTDPQTDALGVVRNEYVLVRRADTLFLHRITLFRSGMSHSVSGDDLAKKLGKTPKKLAFRKKGSDS